MDKNTITFSNLLAVQPGLAQVAVANELCRIIDLFRDIFSVNQVWNGINAKILSPPHAEIPDDQMWGVCEFGVTVFEGKIHLERNNTYWLISGEGSVGTAIDNCAIPCKGDTIFAVNLKQIEEILSHIKDPVPVS